jgi:M6 family metalloprotease-like protein
MKGNKKRLSFKNLHILYTCVLILTLLTVIYTNFQSEKTDFRSRAYINAGNVKVVKTVVILFNFQNNKFQPFTVEEAKEAIFTGDESIRDYYSDMSYGQFILQGVADFSGDVFGWFTIDYNVPKTDEIDCSPESINKWSQLANQEAQIAGVQLNTYDRVIYIFPLSQGVCKDFHGRTEVIGKRTWIVVGNNRPIKIYKHLINHEIGHVAGVDHAEGYRCFDNDNKRVSISKNCKLGDDPYETMGWGNGYFSNFHKERAGWYSPDAKRTITKDGTYTLGPQELKSSDHPQILRIPRGENDDGSIQYFYLEYRQPIGYDKLNYFRDNPFNTDKPEYTVFTGVSIRIAPSNCQEFNKSCDSLLIDSSPQTDSFNDAALQVGQKFIDPDRKISIHTLKVSTSAATVAIKLDESSLPTHTPAPSSGNEADSTILTFSILLHGIGSAGDGANPNNSESNKMPLTKRKSLDVELLNNTTKIISKRVTLIYNNGMGGYTGKLDLGKSFPSGTYTLKLKSSKYLQEVISNMKLISLKNNQLPTLKLTTGDINGDNIINALDYSMLLDCGYGVPHPLSNINSESVFRMEKCQSHRSASNVDLDDNGIIDSRDYNLFLRELSKFKFSN